MASIDPSGWSMFWVRGLTDRANLVDFAVEDIEMKAPFAWAEVRWGWGDLPTSGLGSRTNTWFHFRGRERRD